MVDQTNSTFLTAPTVVAALMHYVLYTQGKMSYTLNTITQATRALHLTAHCRCWTCEHVSRRQHVNKFWAYAGGLTNPCGPGVENV